MIKRKNLNSVDVNLLRQEAEILKTLHHENIVTFKHVCKLIYNKICCYLDEGDRRKNISGHGTNVWRAINIAYQREKVKRLEVYR